jgi:hypothetical protein
VAGRGDEKLEEQVMEETLDFSIAGMTPPRRQSHGPYGIGAGDVAPLMLALGKRDPMTAPSWMRKKVAPMLRMGNEPRFLLEKAGRVKRLASGDAQKTGVNREAELFLAFVEMVEQDDPKLPDVARDIDPDSLVWGGALPREFSPFFERQSPLVARPDGWGRRRSGGLVTLSLKCARYGYDRPAWWNGITEAPWYLDTQCQSEMGVLDSRHSLLIVGCGWIRDEDDPRDDGDVLVLPVERDDVLIEECRDTARQSWARIQQLRAA